MVKNLCEIGFLQSLDDEYVFYQDDIIFIMYVKDGMFFSNSDDTFTHITQQMKVIGTQ